MKKQGTVVRWQDDRGFGFIRSRQSTADVFFHIRDYRGAGTPRQGLAVTFEEIHVGGKGPRAIAVQTAHPSAPPRPGPERRRSRAHPDAGPAGSAGSVLAVPLMLAYAIVLGWAVLGRLVPWWVLPASLLLNLGAFWMYWQDKHSASQRRWRTREDTLHFWSLAGGWGGAWFAQQIHRHKTRKATFQKTYWTTVVLHCGAVAGWLWWIHR